MWLDKEIRNMAQVKKSLFAQLNALAEEINGDAVKAAAATKQAGPTPADPGGMQGATTHPTKDVDNNSRPASTGSRATEYEADVKDQQGALAVDNTKPGSQEGRQDDVQLNIGTTAKATGEDPSVEDDYKGDKDDPGTTHPAKANDGEKYSSVSLKEAREKCSHLGNDILAALITAADVAPAKTAAAEPKKDEPKPATTDKSAAAYQAGYDLAASLGIEKDAAEAGVREVCANTLREADERANLVIGYLSEKAASDPTAEGAEGEDHGAAEGGSGASDAPAPGGGMDAMLGGDPAAAGAGADLGAAPPSEDEALQELAMALEELGISPEELLQMISGGGAAGGDPAAAGGMPPADPMAGGAPPMDPAAGGMPPMGPEKMAAAKQIAAAVKNFRLSGRFQVKEARTKRSRDLRDIMKAHVRELISR
jgi:hypothetical protein